MLTRAKDFFWVYFQFVNQFLNCTSHSQSCQITEIKSAKIQKWKKNTLPNSNVFLWNSSKNSAYHFNLEPLVFLFLMLLLKSHLFFTYLQYSFLVWVQVHSYFCVSLANSVTIERREQVIPWTQIANIERETPTFSVYRCFSS